MAMTEAQKKQIITGEALEAALGVVKNAMDSLDYVDTELSQDIVEMQNRLTPVESDVELLKEAMPGIATKTKAGIVKPSTGLSISTSGELTVDFSPAEKYTDDKIDALVGEGVDDALDTLKEIGDAIKQGSQTHEALLAAIGQKANTSALSNYYTKTETGNTFVKKTDLTYMTAAEATAIFTAAFNN